MEPFPTAILAYADADTEIWVGQAAPRIDIFSGGVKTAAYFGFDPTFRPIGGPAVNIAYDAVNNDLYLSAGVGGGQFVMWDDLDLIGPDAAPKRLAAEMVGMLMTGWTPSVPAHPRYDPILEIEQHPLWPIDRPGVLAAYRDDLTYVPRHIQEYLRDAGVRIVAHSAPHLLVGEYGNPIRTFYDVLNRTIFVGFGGGLPHEIGHAFGNIDRGDGSEEFAERFVNWCYFGDDPLGEFSDR